MGSLPRDKAGVGSAVNDTTRQVGGALGVAIIGSVYSSVYASSLASHLSSLHLPGAVSAEATGSIGGALAVASHAGGATGQAIADSARQAFVTGMHHGVIVGAVIALIGGLIALAFLPARAPEAADEGVEVTEPNMFDLLPGEDGALLEGASA
jgi:MFS transporter, DHA2 family, multidrug resistance protein